MFFSENKASFPVLTALVLLLIRGHASEQMPQFPLQWCQNETSQCKVGAHEHALGMFTAQLETN